MGVWDLHRDSYRDLYNSQYGTAIVGTVSGYSITFGTPVVFNNSTTSSISCTYDPVTNKVVISYRGDISVYGTSVVGTVSGNSITFGTPVVFNSRNTEYISSTYDPASNKVVITYKDSANSGYGTVVLGTVSGDSITFGTSEVFNSGNTYHISSVYDSVNNKVVIAYQDYGNSSYGTAIVGTVSGDSIAFGTPEVFNNNGTTSYISSVYDPVANRVVISYRDYGNSNYGTVIPGTVSGDAISFGTPEVFNNNGTTTYISTIYDFANSQIVISYTDNGNSEYGTAVTYSSERVSTNLTATNFIGVSDGDYADGETATVQLRGSVDDAQSGLTPEATYYVQVDGSINTTVDNPSVLAGTAIDTDLLLIKE